MTDPINRMEIDPEATKEYAQRAKLLAVAEDALTLLEGWIRRYCKPSFMAEHLDDLAKKRAILEAAKAPPPYVKSEDSKRLDWLSKADFVMFQWKGGEPVNPTKELRFTGRQIRTVIDTAMAERPSPVAPPKVPGWDQRG